MQEHTLIQDQLDPGAPSVHQGSILELSVSLGAAPFWPGFLYMATPRGLRFITNWAVFREDSSSVLMLSQKLSPITTISQLGPEPISAVKGSSVFLHQHGHLFPHGTSGSTHYWYKMKWYSSPWGAITCTLTLWPRNPISRKLSHQCSWQTNEICAHKLINHRAICNDKRSEIIKCPSARDWLNKTKAQPYNGAVKRCKEYCDGSFYGLTLLSSRVPG